MGECKSQSHYLCSCAKSKGSVFLGHTIDTSGMPHTSDNLQRITKDAIDKALKKFGCVVKSVVTDNAANMLKMGRQLNVENDQILTYGCGAHMLNLLAHNWTPIQLCKRKL